MVNSLDIGTIIHNKYCIERVLGQGGFGITYLATDEAIGAPVVIKEFFPAAIVERAANGSEVRPRQPEYESDFRRGIKKMLAEGRALSGLHAIPEIVRVLDYFQENNTAYLAMEFIRGTSLRSYIERLDDPLTFAEARDMLMPVIRALGQVHKKKIIHRDLTPDNLLVRETGKIKIIDFGSAREFAEDERTRTILIKAGYAPPEQYAAKSKQGPWTDVYSLCATMYEMLTGVIPQDALLRMHSDELYPPSMYGAEIAPEEEQALMRGLALDYRKRFASMAELASAFSPSSGTMDEPRNGRMWLLAILAACAITVAAAGGIYLATKDSKDTVAYAGNYDRGSDEYREFVKYVKEHALSKKKTEDGILYQMSPEDALDWGKPCNRVRYALTLEEFLDKLDAANYHIDGSKEKAAECTVELRKYGAVLTSFVNSRKYEIAPDVTLKIEYDMVNHDITMMVLRGGKNAGDSLEQTKKSIKQILPPYEIQPLCSKITGEHETYFFPTDSTSWSLGNRYYWP